MVQLNFKVKLALNLSPCAKGEALFREADRDQKALDISSE